jgi:hypothetical protein
MTTLMTPSSSLKALSKFDSKNLRVIPFHTNEKIFAHKQNCLAYNKARVNLHFCEKHHWIATIKNDYINDTVKLTKNLK